MLVQVLALGSAVALASGLAFRRQNGSLRQRRCSKTCLRASLAPRSLSSTLDPADKLDSRRQSSNGVNAAPVPVSGSRNLYAGARKGFLALRQVFLISMGGRQKRDQHLNRLATGKRNPGTDASDKKLNRRINLSIGAMGLAAAGCLFYAPLLRLAGASSLYIFFPVFQELSKNLRKGRITTELLEIVSLISFLVSGYVFLAAFVSFLALLNFKLLKRTEEHSHDQLIESFSQKRHSLWVMKDGTEVEIPLAAVRKQDIVVVNAGEIIPVDGTVTEGLASVDQQSLTGECQPIEIGPGDKVFATTVVLAGRLLIRAEQTGCDTNAAQIGHILEHTQLYKDSVRLRGKHIADGFIAPTLCVSCLTLALLGANAAMAILWSGFGYNMKLYGPITVLNFLHILAKNGILIKDGRSLEMLQQIDTVVFDKTGTLTVEQPQLASIYPIPPFDEETLLAYAAAAERRQSHPIARAIWTAAQQRGLELPIVEDAAYRIGYGIEVNLDRRLIRVGSSRFMQQQGIPLEDRVRRFQQQSDAKGSSLVYVAVDDNLAGILELEPCIRPEAKRIVDYLKAEGVGIYVISGDHEEPTRRLAEQLGIENYFFETLPAEKAKLIADLRDNGRFVGYIGDGINDAIALKQANVSMSLRGASTAATDTAQIILMDGDLDKLESLFEISKNFEKDMQTNYLNSIIPGVITLSGVILLNMGLAGSMLVYFSSKLIGLMHCMLPLVKDGMQEPVADESKRDDINSHVGEIATEQGCCAARTL